MISSLVDFNKRRLLGQLVRDSEKLRGRLALAGIDPLEAGFIQSMVDIASQTREVMEGRRGQISKDAYDSFCSAYYDLAITANKALRRRYVGSDIVTNILNLSFENLVEGVKPKERFIMDEGRV